MTKQMGAFTLEVNKDDRGRMVAEVWHNASGKTMGISEVNTEADARHWAKKLIAMQGEESPCSSAS